MVDFIDIFPLAGFAAARLAAEGQILEDARDLIVRGAPHFKRVDRQGAKGEKDFALVRLSAEGMDGGLVDMVVKLGIAIQAFHGALDEGSACCGSADPPEWGCPRLGRRWSRAGQPAGWFFLPDLAWAAGTVGMALFR